MLAYALALQGVLLALAAPCTFRRRPCRRAVLCVQADGGRRTSLGRPTRPITRSAVLSAARPELRGRSGAGLRRRSGCAFAAPVDLDPAPASVTPSYVHRPAARFARAAALRLEFEPHTRFPINRTGLAIMKISFRPGALVATGLFALSAPALAHVSFETRRPPRTPPTRRSFASPMAAPASRPSRSACASRTAWSRSSPCPRPGGCSRSVEKAYPKPSDLGKRSPRA